MEEINEINSLGTGGRLVRSFASLLRCLWQQRGRVYDPIEFHSTLAEFAPHLTEGYAQQDAQEFLAYLLDGLHEDLNLVERRPPPDEEDTDEQDLRLELEKGEEYVAALKWMRHLLRNKSFLVDLLQGQLRSCLTCSVCGFTSKTFDPVLYLSLPVHDQMRTLDEAFKLFLASEMLTGENQWRCDRCKCSVDAEKRIDIWTLPQVLVVHLKRFEFDSNTSQFRKIESELRSPLTVDLTRYVSTQRRQRAIYDIVCIANHYGRYGSGHYTATCKHPVDRKFYNLNDSYVQELADHDSVLDKNAYVLFLVRSTDQA